MLWLIVMIMITDYRVRHLPLRLLRRRPGRRARARFASLERRSPYGSQRFPTHGCGGYQCFYLVTARWWCSLPRPAAVGGAFPYRDGAAGAVPETRRPGQRRALRSTSTKRWPRTRDPASDRERARPHMERGTRRLHVHRVRPLQGRLPDSSPASRLSPKVGERRDEASPARAARRARRQARRCRRSSGVVGDGRCGPAPPAAIARRRVRSSSSTCRKFYAAAPAPRAD